MNKEDLMQRCFDLATLGRGSVSPNPMVGALLVYNGKIIGEGWHKKHGDAHAEVNAINSILPENQPFISQSTLYCSLEPCAHFGKTPPCVDLILKHKIAKVVIANTDPNPLVAGKSIDKLRQNGVEVEVGVLEETGKQLNRAFFKWITQKKPFIVLKWAQSADGFIAKKGEQTTISSEYTKRLVHQWRSECDAILVGTNTALIDNPHLDARFYGNKNPLRCVLDIKGKLSVNANLLDDSTETWVFGEKREGFFEKTRFIDTNSTTFLDDLMSEMYENGKAILLVEGGANLLNQFIQQNLWDEIRLIESEIRLGDGVNAPRFLGGKLDEEFFIKKDKIKVFIPA
jgi:diaminohydroxyphosphoribosylaminopyrimidine deaminase / 5-amino-6-(5-phosphoribosylamino)uracil reductase